MEQLTSLSQLIKSTVVAITVAVAILVLFVLPAEYGVDPTGIGQRLGLTQLTLTNKTNDTGSEVSSNSYVEKVVEITVPANRGIEYKVNMNQHDKLNYEWVTNGTPLYFDLHGEPKGDTTGYFESYAIATAHTMQGSFTTPFEGTHGWYWKNNTSQSVVVRLIMNGTFEVIDGH
ncbi:hypothetical protein [Sessilibacter corallicola]|uniref:hypothetical protein n=1 Tax=Sessilibacter corallicola TaxID=2904075 RepID=UPI001E30B568|nr:hypothetical protein [Sessilibacter corallicola]MCE2029685.1 hypothetical protein [Sessilibacter corallicola]